MIQQLPLLLFLLFTLILFTSFFSEPSWYVRIFPQRIWSPWALQSVSAKIPEVCFLAVTQKQELEVGHEWVTPKTPRVLKCQVYSLLQETRRGQLFLTRGHLMTIVVLLTDFACLITYMCLNITKQINHYEQDVGTTYRTWHIFTDMGEKKLQADYFSYSIFL